MDAHCSGQVHCVRECVPGAVQGKVQPLWIAGGATTLVVQEAYLDADYRCKDSLVWRADGAAQRYALGKPDAPTIFWRHVDRAAILDTLVVPEKSQGEEAKVIWTAAGGGEHVPFP